jgi:hypothetical protein
MTRIFFDMCPRERRAFQCHRKGGCNCITLIKGGHRPHQAAGGSRLSPFRFKFTVTREDFCLILDKLEKNYPEAPCTAAISEQN